MGTDCSGACSESQQLTKLRQEGQREFKASLWLYDPASNQQGVKRDAEGQPPCDIHPCVVFKSVTMLYCGLTQRFAGGNK